MSIIGSEAVVDRDGSLGQVLTHSGHRLSDRSNVLEINCLSGACIPAVNSDSEFDALELVWRMTEVSENVDDV
jgi:hypothetical protein